MPDAPLFVPVHAKAGISRFGVIEDVVSPDVDLDPEFGGAVLDILIISQECQPMVLYNAKASPLPTWVVSILGERDIEVEAVEYVMYVEREADIPTPILLSAAYSDRIPAYDGFFFVVRSW